jgi:DNA-directed RNA polymerase subunit RPC12/RpoP
MSYRYRYRCKDCGHVWRDIAAKEGENPFLRCTRCDSANIFFPKGSRGGGNTSKVEVPLCAIIVTVIVLAVVVALAFIIASVG